MVRGKPALSNNTHLWQSFLRMLNLKSSEILSTTTCCGIGRFSLPFAFYVSRVEQNKVVHASSGWGCSIISCLLCFGTAVVELAPCLCQDSRVAHQIPQKTQDSLVQSSPKLRIVSPPPPLLCNCCIVHLMYTLIVCYMSWLLMHTLIVFCKSWLLMYTQYLLYFVRPVSGCTHLLYVLRPGS